MSNCIDLRQHRVRFSEKEIDIPALSKLCLDSKESDKDFPRDEKQFNPVKYLVAWFVLPNTYFDGDAVEIHFGERGSAHTFRDFRSVINVVLKPLMKRSKVHRFRVQDAENPQLGWSWWPIDFYKGVDQ
jgi:hypothetical protein